MPGLLFSCQVCVVCAIDDDDDGDDTIADADDTITADARSLVSFCLWRSFSPWFLLMCLSTPLSQVPLKGP